MVTLVVMTVVGLPAEMEASLASVVIELACIATSTVQVSGNVPLKNRCDPAAHVGMVEAVGSALVCPTAI